MRRLAWLALIGTAAPLHADVIVVAQSGGGDYTTIQEAYAASRTGDTILVRAGNYYAGPTTVIEHGVSIVAEPRDDVFAYSLRVLGLPESEAVVISGFDGLNRISVQQSLGDVRIQDSLVDSGASWQSALALEGARSVVVEHCVILGEDGANQMSEGYPGGDAVVATDGSHVALYDCELRAGDGGDGYSGFVCIAYGAPGGNAVTVEGSELYAMGCQLYAGAGGEGKCGGFDGHAGYALSVDDHSDAVVTNVLLVPAPGGTATMGDFIVDLGVNRRELVAPTLVREGETMNWKVYGRPGDLVYLPASLQPKWRYVPTALGVQTFDFPLLEPLQLAGVIGQGSTMTLQLPSQTLAPGEESRTTFHEVFVLDSHGQRILGGGKAVVTVDAAF